MNAFGNIFRVSIFGESHGEQIGDDFQKLYPGANILVATKKDFQKANRQQLFAKIATGNYDA